MKYHDLISPQKISMRVVFFCGFFHEIYFFAELSVFVRINFYRASAHSEMKSVLTPPLHTDTFYPKHLLFKATRRVLRAVTCHTQKRPQDSSTPNLSGRLSTFRRLFRFWITEAPSSLPSAIFPPDGDDGGGGDVSSRAAGDAVSPTHSYVSVPIVQKKYESGATSMCVAWLRYTLKATTHIRIRPEFF